MGLTFSKRDDQKLPPSFVRSRRQQSHCSRYWSLIGRPVRTYTLQHSPPASHSQHQKDWSRDIESIHDLLIWFVKVFRRPLPSTMDTLVHKHITKYITDVLHLSSHSHQKQRRHDSSHGDRPNLLTTNDASSFNSPTAYAYRLDWGWKRSPEAESEYHAPQNAAADRQFDRLLKQDRRKVGRKRSKLQKKFKAAVHVSFWRSLLTAGRSSGELSTCVRCETLSHPCLGNWTEALEKQA